MNSKKYLTLLLIPLLATIACTTNYSNKDRYSQSSKDGIRVQEKTMRFKATVVKHKDPEGVYYTLLSTNGGEYYPVNLEFPYRHNGLQVQVYGETEGYALGGSMRAFRIHDIATR